MTSGTSCVFDAIEDVFKCFIRQNHFILANQLGLLFLTPDISMYFCICEQLLRSTVC
jgi:hypothetical protein